MSDYDPYQFSLARANVIGNTVSNVSNTLIDTASKVTEIAKQKGINDKIKTAYTDILNKFADEAISRYPGMKGGRDAALIAARKVYRQPMEGLSAEDNLKLLLSGDVNAQKVLDSYSKMSEENKKKQVQQQGAVAAQRVSGVDRQYTPEVDTGLGFTEATVTSETPAPQYREDAMARYGGLAAEGEVPVQTTKELEQQPIIAALPARPEPERPAYQQWEMKFKEDEARRKEIEKRLEKGGMTKDDTEKNVKWALSAYDSYVKSFQNSKGMFPVLDKAFAKLDSGKILDDDDITELEKAGYRGGRDKDSINRARYDAMRMEQPSKEAAKKYKAMAKKLASGKSIPEAEGEYEQENASSAMRVLGETVQSLDNPKPLFSETPTQFQSPTLAGLERNIKKYKPTLQKILDSTPIGARYVILEKVDAAKAQGLSDEEIAEGLLMQGRNAR